MNASATSCVSPWARELFQALAALRASVEPLSSPANARHWRALYQGLRPLFEREGPDGDDDCQELMLALASSLGTIRAETPIRAAAYLRVVRRNLRVDRLRARAKHKALSLDDHDRPVEAPVLERVPFERLDAVIAAFEATVAHELALSETNEERRALAMLQARATVRRLLLEESTSEIARVLGRDLSADLVSKWIERGRVVVLETIAILREEDPDAADLYDVLAELAATRRSDAGRARPERRRPRLEPN